MGLGGGSFSKETIVALGNALVLGYRRKIVDRWATSVTEAQRAEWRRRRETDPSFAKEEYSWVILQRDLSGALDAAGLLDRRFSRSFNTEICYPARGWLRIASDLDELAKSDADFAKLRLCDVNFSEELKQYAGIEDAKDSSEFRTPVSSLDPTPRIHILASLLIQALNDAFPAPARSRSEGPIHDGRGLSATLDCHAETATQRLRIRSSGQLHKRPRGEILNLEALIRKAERLILRPVREFHVRSIEGADLVALADHAIDRKPDFDRVDPEFIHNLEMLGERLSVSNRDLPQISEEKLGRVFLPHGAEHDRRSMPSTMQDQQKPQHCF